MIIALGSLSVINKWWVCACFLWSRVIICYVSI